MTAPCKCLTLDPSRDVGLSKSKGNAMLVRFPTFKKILFDGEVTVSQTVLVDIAYLGCFKMFLTSATQ
ncbi:hypothetical protein scyTo_0010900 [Scyliorhinus torazame]|uniref:Uncharacterized protein n=1 Tax=Scyliorhinus torazame TaxID=75743 RepID=A0A401PD03_SCYTO|nr:hypothetical protein [Scyliorhinus torazame]